MPSWPRTTTSSPSYTEAAAKDRESQEKNRQAEALAREARERELRATAERDDRHMVVQRWQGWNSVVFTLVIAASTVVSAAAAWRTSQQPTMIAVPTIQAVGSPPQR